MTEVWVIIAGDDIDSVWSEQADAQDRVDELDNEGAEVELLKFTLNKRQGLVS